MATGLGEVLRDRVFMAFVALSLFIDCVFLQGWSTFPIDLSSHGISASTYGLILSVNGILIVLLQPFASLALRRFRRSRVLAVAALLVGAGFGLNAFPTSAGGYAVYVAILTLGEIAASPMSSSIVADLAPAHLRGRYQGIFTASGGLASFLAPIMGTQLLAHGGGRAVWGTCFAVGVVVAVGHLAIANARKRRLQELAASAAA